LSFEVFPDKQREGEKGIHLQRSVEENHRLTYAGAIDNPWLHGCDRRSAAVRVVPIPRSRGGGLKAQRVNNHQEPLRRRKISEQKAATFMKRVSGDTPNETAGILWRRHTKERLESNLKSLSSYCKPGVFAEDDARKGWADAMLSAVFGPYKRLACWPSRELLREIENDVLFLAFRERRNPIFPVWKAFEQVDKRIPKLRLRLRLDNLIRHARDILPRESALGAAVTKARAGEPMAQCLLRDIAMNESKLAKLLMEDRHMVRLQCMAYPLVAWLIEIGHPTANDLNNIVEFLPTAEDVRALHRLEKTRERVRRHRLRKKRSLENVTPA